MKTFITAYILAFLIVLFSIFYYCCDGKKYIESQIKEMKMVTLMMHWNLKPEGLEG